MRTSARRTRAQAVQRFAVADLSNWYLDIAKDRLYVRAPASADRRACQTVMHALLQARPRARRHWAGAPPAWGWGSAGRAAWRTEAEQCAARRRRALGAQGLLPVLAPLAPHLAEDAWQSLPWAAPAASVFQAGWFAPPDAWRSAAADAPVSYGALLALRCAPAPPRRAASSVNPTARAGRARGARAGAR